MRLLYEPPEIALLGSVTNLTQANLSGPASDNLISLLRGPADPVFS